MMDRGAGVPKTLRESTTASLRESERLHARWNGRAGGRIHYAFAPRFILSCSEKLLRTTAEMAQDLGAIVHSHASEHAGEREAVRKIFGTDDVPALAQMGIAGENVVLALGVQLTKAQMRSVARAGTRFVHCPSANLKLASGIANITAMQQAGITLGSAPMALPATTAWTLGPNFDKLRFLPREVSGTLRHIQPGRLWSLPRSAAPKS